MSLIEFKLARAWAGGITVAGMASVSEDSVSFKPTGLLRPLMRKKAFELPPETFPHRISGSLKYYHGGPTP